MQAKKLETITLPIQKNENCSAQVICWKTDGNKSLRNKSQAT